MAWHYRDCDLGHGAWQAKQLHVSLLQLSKRLPISVYAGDKVGREGVDRAATCFVYFAMARGGDGVFFGSGAWLLVVPFTKR